MKTIIRLLIGLLVLPIAIPIFLVRVAWMLSQDMINALSDI